MAHAPEDGIEVVISGIGGYFPRSSNVEVLTKALMDHVDGVGQARWKAGQLDLSNKTGIADNTNNFDASYFALHRKQAVYTDPLCRMVLQNTLEALIDAGLTPASIRKRRVMVAAASSVSDHDINMYEHVEYGCGVVGQARSMIANRVSYWLNINGPSYSCDASWLGGFQVLKHAYDSISSGQCEAAIVSAAGLTMNICQTFHFQNMKLICPDGVTRAFDENAEGYARSDGTCVLILQRANEARRRYATLVNTDLIFNGARSGQFIDIDPDNAHRFLTDFYKRSGVDPLKISYVEAYGSAVKKVDKIELDLIDRVFNAGKREEPLMIGSVKSNLGHTEANSVLTSIVKVIISMETNTIPANLHYTTPNSKVPALLEGRLQVVTDNTPWTGNYAAVNGFGIASSYGHAILKKNSIEKRPDAEEIAKRFPLLYVISTRTEESIKDVVESIKSRKDFNLDFVNLLNETFTTNISGYLYRGYVLKTTDNVREETEYYSGMSRPIWFIYSGMGSQWLTMGQQLLQLPVFAKSIKKCSDALQPVGLDLINILTGKDENIFDNILNSFVGIAAVQIGLTDILFSLGITPDGLLGHSVGELGCAYADGCLTAKEMILSAYYRGRASMEAELVPGLMAAVGVGAKDAAEKIIPSVDIACHNGPDSCTLSGPKNDMEILVKKLQEQEIFARLVNVSGIAYHSRYIRPAAPILLKYLKELIPEPKERSSKWLSTSVPESRWNTEHARHTSAEYLTNNLLSSVYFEEALKHIPKEAILIEIAPHGLLQAILKRSVHKESINIALTKRGEKNMLQFLFTAIGKLYLHGTQVDLRNLYDGIYPNNRIVPRGTPHLAPLVRWAHGEEWQTGVNQFVDNSNRQQSYPIDNNCEWFKHVIGHKIHNVAVIPSTSFFPLVLDVLLKTLKVNVLELTDYLIKRHRNLPFRDEYQPPVEVTVQKSSGLFDVSDQYGVVATGQALVPEPHQQQILVQEIIKGKDPKLMGKELFKLTEDEIYSELFLKGLELSGIYRSITEFILYEDGLEASILWKNWHAFVTSIFHASLIYSSSHSLAIVPGFIKRLIINFDNLPEENTLLKVRYLKSIDTFWSSILLLEGAKCCKPIGMIRQTKQAIKASFIPYIIKNDPQINISIVVDTCLRIVKSQLKTNVAEIHVAIDNNSITKPISNILEEISQNNYSLKVQLHSIYNFCNYKKESIHTLNLFVINSENSKIIPEYLEKYSGVHVLVCSENLQDKIKHNLVRVLSYQKDNYNIQLFKQKVNSDQPEIFNVAEKDLKDDDLENTSISWIRDLHLKLLNSTGRVYIIFRSLPVIDIDSFVKAIQQLKAGHKARVVFVLDEKAPKVTLTEPFYIHIFQQDLTISVFENGLWGFRYVTSIKLTDKDFNEEDTQIHLEFAPKNGISVRVSNIDVKFIGVHAENVIPVERSDVTAKVGLVDYCGLKKNSNIAVMGICNRSFQPDPIFQWRIPKNWTLNWTLENSATIPAAYSNAYYALVELVNLTKGEHVLINNGSYSLGQAMIRVAYDLGAVVLVSVANGWQKAQLLKLMPVLNSDRIFKYTSKKFEQNIMAATRGEGVQVLVNSFQGDRLHTNNRFISTMGRAILLQNETDDNCVNTDTIGLSLFLRCSGLYGMRPAKLCDLDNYMKKRVWELVQRGLDNGTVVPLGKTTFKPWQPFEQIIKSVTGYGVIGCAVLPVQDNIYELPQKQIFQCNPNNIYLIYANEISVIEEVLHTSVWLARHGAQRLHIVFNPNNKEEITLLKRQLQSFSIKIEFNKTFPSNIKDLAACIVLPGNKDPKTIPADARIVQFLGISSPLPSQNLRSTLRWDEKSRFTEVLPFLGHALTENVDLKVLVEDNEVGDDNDGERFVEENFTHQDFFQLLARSVPSLAFDKSKETISLKLVASASPKYVTEVPPLFIIPGFLGEKCKYLQETIAKIMCPVYIVDIRYKNQKMEQLSTTIEEKIRKINPKGPYNIAGVSIGGIMALELTKYLEKTVGSNQVQLYLVDAVPATIQHLLQETQTNFYGSDGVILQHLLEIDQTNIANEIFIKNKTWQTKLEAALSLYNYTKVESQRITNTLNGIRENFEEILNYSPDERIINTFTRVIRPHLSSTDFTSSLLNTCKQVKVEIVEGNHFTMLQSPLVAEYINDNIMIPPRYT